MWFQWKHAFEPKHIHDKKETVDSCHFSAMSLPLEGASVSYAAKDSVTITNLTACRAYEEILEFILQYFIGTFEINFSVGHSMSGYIKSTLLAEK